jgi:head-tail adaptor
MIGDYKHLVTFQDPVDVPDGVGGYTQTWHDLTPPTWKVQIAPVSATDQERSSGGTVMTAVLATVRGHYHPGVTTRTRMLYNGKTYQITAATAVDDRPPTMELMAVEQGTP